MLYLLDVEIDYARMGDRLAEVRAAEHTRVKELIAEGVVVVEWLDLHPLTEHPLFPGGRSLPGGAA